MSRWGTLYTKIVDGVTLRPGSMPSGHVSVSLGRNNSQCVHKLVLLAFVGAAPEGHECCHNNGDPSDNRIENLRWGTRSENNIDAVKHGRRGKLTEAEVKEIRRRLIGCQHGEQTKLAREFGVSVCTINSIKFGRVYGYV